MQLTDGFYIAMFQASERGKRHQPRSNKLPDVCNYLPQSLKEKLMQRPDVVREMRRQLKAASPRKGNGCFLKSDLAGRRQWDVESIERYIMETVEK